jgi:hypothetical protein
MNSPVMNPVRIALRVVMVASVVMGCKYDNTTGNSKQVFFYDLPESSNLTSTASIFRSAWIDAGLWRFHWLTL